MLPTPSRTLPRIGNDALSMIRRRPYRSPLPLFLLGLALSVGTVQGEERKDREFKECANCPVMVGIPAGSFVMGSPPSETGRFDTEGPQHKVAIKAFALGKYDITSEEFLTFLRDTGYQPAPCNPTARPGLALAGPRPGLSRLMMPSRRTGPRSVSIGTMHSAYIDWLNAEVRKERPRHGAPNRTLSPAERSGMGICRARRHHDGALVGRRDRRQTMPTAMAAAASGTSACSPMSMPSRPTASDYTACWAMPGNGPRIAGTRPMTARQTMAAPGPTADCRKHVIRGGSWDNVPIFVRSAARSGGGASGDGEYDYSTLTGFRVARDLP